MFSVRSLVRSAGVALGLLAVTSSCGSLAPELELSLSPAPVDANYNAIAFQAGWGSWNLCIDVPYANYYAGAQLWVWSCNAPSYYAQRFSGNYPVLYGNPLDGDGVIRVDNGLCVDVPNFNAGTQVQIWYCNGLVNQQWTYDRNSGALRSQGDPSKCIDVWQWNTNPGTPIKLWTCTGAQNQGWAIRG